MSKVGTACLDCKFFRNISPQGSTEWYNNLCMASPKPLVFDYLKGEMVKPYIEFDYCRDINRGNCKLFQERIKET
jgi:hypothetical protein